MKKILFTLAAAAMVLGAASCQKENLGQIKEVKTVDNPLNTILVKVASDTKLAINENTLAPEFEEGDVIFGWDNDGTTYAYTCTGVAEDVATFTRSSSGAPSANEGTWVNLVFAPGYDLEDIQDKTLDVNLAIQGETLPVVMHCGAEVDAQGICQAVFSNDVAIVDVKDAVLPGAVEDEEYTISFHGKNTSLKFTLDEDGSLVVASASEGPISSSVKAVVGADSKISKKFAVPASLEATDVIITATAADGSSYAFKVGEKPINAGKYITVADKEFTPQYVAQIGETKYTSIVKAFTDANIADSPVTVTLLENCAITASLPTIKNTNKITLDLAGKKLETTATGAGADDADRFCRLWVSGGDLEIISSVEGGEIWNSPATSYTVIQFKGSLTIGENVKISAVDKSDSSKGSIAILSQAGDLTITGGEFEGNSANGTISAQATEGNRVNLKISGTPLIVSPAKKALYTLRSDVEISGGTFKALAPKADKQVCFNVSSDCNVTVSGGVFEGEYNVVVGSSKNEGHLNITGGFFAGSSSYSIVYGYDGGMPIVVSGGYFNQSIAAKYIKSGYVIKPSSEYEDYPYVIAEESDVAEVTTGTGTVCYKKINEAFTAAKEAGTATVKLLDHCVLADSVSLSTACNITLDLDGKRLTAPSTKRINVRNAEATLTICSNDAAAAGEYYQSGTGSFALQCNAGKVVINSGKVYSADKNTSVLISLSQQGELVVNGGHITKKDGNRLVSSTSDNVKITVNGGTLEMVTEDESVASTSVQAIGARGTVTITGGVISSTNGCAVLTGNSTTVNISGGTIISTAAAADSIAMRLRGNVSISGDVLIRHLEGRGVYFMGPNADNRTNVSITGGTIQSKNYSVYVYSNATVTFEEGSTSFVQATGSSTGYLGSKSAVLNVKGGKFRSHSTKPSFARYTTEAGATISVTGGTFFTLLGASEDGLGDKNGSYLATGYELKSDGAGDYKYYVVKSE